MDLGLSAGSRKGQTWTELPILPLSVLESLNPEVSFLFWKGYAHQIVQFIVLLCSNTETFFKGNIQFLVHLITSHHVRFISFLPFVHDV